LAHSDTKIRVGLIGTGRLGIYYADILATRITNSKLVAVAGHSAETIAVRYEVPNFCTDRLGILDKKLVDCIVVCSSTDTHEQIVMEALATGLPVFCEKPITLGLIAANRIQEYIHDHGSMFQMGFMRRFDRGYAEAKQLLTDGKIDGPYFFRSTSKDLSRPTTAYLKTSGGLMLDMGIHDFDLARWYMGDVESVTACGGRLVYPELEEVDDIDTAVITLKFASGKMGVVDLARHAAYGYEIFTEIQGLNGAIRIGYHQQTPCALLQRNTYEHDIVNNFMGRFEEAFRLQLHDFVTNVLFNRLPTVTIDDGVKALQIALLAKYAYQTRQQYRLGVV
jgi:scyllo-inositol 2-dehydrogenase (NAD+)